MKNIVFIICVLLLVGCGGVTDKGIREAYKLCMYNGGVEKVIPLYIDTSDSAKVYCKNGLIITYEAK